MTRSESEDRFRLLFDSVADALFLHDLAGRVVEVNQAACDSLGYAREELLQLPLSTIVQSPSLEVRCDLWARVIQGEKLTAQGLHRRQDGTTFPIEVHLSRFEYSGRPHILAAARDITKRLQAEDALRTSESFLNSIIDQSPYPMWISDAQGTLIRLNQACRDLLNINPEEVIDTYNVFQDNIVAEQGGLPLLQRVFEKGETVRFELVYDTSRLKTLQLKNTVSAILDVTVSPIKDGSGKITNAVFQHVDITHRKRAEAALAESEQRFSTFMAHLPAAAFIKDQEGRLLFANRYLREIFGWDDCLGKTTEELVPPEFAARMVADDRRALTEGPIVIQERIIDIQGVEHFFDTYKFPVAAEGAPLLVGGIAVNVTERKRTEEALKREKLFTEAILDSLPGTFFLLDSHGRHLRTNTSGQILSGYSSEELSNMHALDFIAEEDKPAAQRAIEKVFEKGEASLEAQHLAKDGRKTPFLFTAKKFILGDLPYILGTGMDISERKQSEEALRESQEYLKTVMESVGAGIMVVDAETRQIVDINPFAENIIGVPREEIIGKICHEHICPAEVGKCPVMDLGLTVDKSERSLLTGSGQTLPILKTVTHFQKEGRKYLLETFLDISERKQAEEALRESEEKFRSLYQEFQGILNAIPDTLCLLSPDLRIVWGNEASPLAASKTSLSEIIGQHCYFLHHGRSEPCEVCPVSRCFKSGEIETEVNTSHGKIWELRAVPIYDDHGELRGAVKVVRDITERKRMEKALQESEARFRQVVESSPLPIGIGTEDGRIEYVNPQFVETFGYTLEDIPQLADWFRLAYPDPAYRQLLLSKWQEAVEKFTREDGTTEAAEVEISCKNGSQRIMEIVGTLMGNKSLVVFHDLTERKRMEEALRDSERRLSEIIDFLPDATFAIDLSGRVIAWNRAIEEMTGIQAESILGQGDYAYAVPFYGIRRPILIDLVFKPDEEIEKNYAFVKRQGDILLAEAEVPVRGERRQLWGKARPLYDREENIVGAIEAIRDLTEHKWAEKALRESEARFRQVVESSPLPIGIAVEEGMIEYVNPKFVETFGYSLKDIPQLEDWYRLAYPDPRYRQKAVKRWQKALEKAARQNRPTKIREVEVTCKDGSQKIIDIFGTLVGKKSLGVFNDVTARKRAEEERARLEDRMREVQKLESLGVLAGGIAHDFNNLLMAILGNADLALLALSPASPARPNVEEIARASQRAADLCRQMLAYSGKGRFVVGRYDLSEIVQEMAQMLRVTVSKKAVLRYSFSADLPAVEVDATQMRQVIMNLITNASEALGDESGVISVATGAMDCDRAFLSESHLDDNLPEGRYVFLEVADTGCGLDEETRRRIFDPFFTTKFTGRGLGLAAVLGIVRGHRGAIKVASEPGQGTTFTILLPAVAWKAGDRVPTAAPAAASRQQGTVLLIDDDPHVRRVAGEMLERLGLQVLTAAQGQEGLEIFRARAGEIDCVLLDLTMPGMGGEEAFQEMRRLRGDVPVVLTSGYDEQDATEQFTGQGLAGFIQKPYTVAKLQEVLNQVLGH